MSATPLVSVVVPTYNQPVLLLETLRSVLAQTLEDFELIVIDDGSTSETADALATLTDRRLRVVRQANAGIGAARNRGIDEARGRYVALLDHDDLWHPTKLAVQVAYFAAHPECVACSVTWSLSTEPTKPVVDVSTIAGPDGLVNRPIARLAEGQVFLTSSSILFDRARVAGLRYETLRNCIEDQPFQIGLFMLGAFGIAGAGEILMVYRKHDSNSSSQAEFFDKGVRHMRALQRAGRFESMSGEDTADLNDLLAHTARTATTRRLAAGQRGHALRLYLDEVSYQVRQGSLMFLLLVPPLLLLPTSVIRRRWNRQR